MIIENYAPGIRALVEQIQERRKNQDPAIMESLETLLKIGQRERDNALIGYAYLYMADAYFDHAYPYDRFLNNLMEGMKYQMLAGENELIARSYNLIAIDALHHGSYDMNVEALISAKSYMDRMPQGFFNSVLLHNFGCAYNRIGDAEEAQRYRKQAADAILQYPEDAQFHRNLIAAYASIGAHYLYHGDPDMAESFWQEIETHIRENHLPGTAAEGADYFLFRSLIARHQGDTEMEQDSLKRFLKLLDDDLVFVDTLESVLNFLHYLLEQKDFETLALFLPRMNRFVETEAVSALTRTLIADFIVEYARAAGGADALSDALTEYCKTGFDQNKDRVRSCNFALEMSRMMTKQRAEQIRILENDIRKRHVAQTDALTDLPNTVYFMDRVEEALDSAVFRHTNLGVSILTIPLELSVDPSRLQEAVATLSALSTSGVCVTKGEANRLLVLYEDMPNSDILQRAADVTHILMPFVQDERPAPKSNFLQRFFKEPQIIGIPHGVCTGVPTAETGGWEYLSVAADAMEASMNNRYEITHFTL